ncbi:MAG: hypothetical protein KC519_03285, partial [Anaerolineae bacterium]|nr:hypothetical protein [Anaerolineae bacterium]
MSDSTMRELDLLSQVPTMLTSFDKDRVLKNVIDFLMRAFDVEQSSLLMLSDIGDTNRWQLFSLRPKFQTAILRAPVSEDAVKQA